MIQIKKRRLLITAISIGILFIYVPHVIPNFLAQSFYGLKKIVRTFGPTKNNFVEVEPGILYRSRQLSANELDNVMKSYGIKTVINLRGKSETRKWWQKEARIVNHNAALLFDISMNAHIITPLDKLKQLAYVLLAAPTPIFIHCKAGIDRTGEAAALYKLLAGFDTNEALQQLSAHFGHSRSAFPQKRKLIKEIEKIYPGFLKEMKSLNLPHRFTVNELKGLTVHQLQEKIEKNFQRK